MEKTGDALKSDLKTAPDTWRKSLYTAYPRIEILYEVDDETKLDIRGFVASLARTDLSGRVQQRWVRSNQDVLHTNSSWAGVGTAGQR
jgi:hypothetical protein